MARRNLPPITQALDEQRAAQKIVDTVEAEARLKKFRSCEHDSVEWDPVETEYKGDDVHVWQEGRCRDCKRLVQREFEPNDAHTTSNEEPEEAG